MKKFFAKGGSFDKFTRELDKTTSAKIGMPNETKISHLLKPGSAHHEEAMKFFHKSDSENDNVNYSNAPSHQPLLSKIELREFEIKEVYASHQYFVRYNNEGKIVGELHGLATDRSTGKKKTMGNIMPDIINIGKMFIPGLENIQVKGDQLKVYEYPEAKQSSNIPAEEPGYSGLYQNNQASKVMLEGEETIISARWDAAHKAVEKLNSRNIEYNALGGDNDNYNSGNSNSVARTLGDIMGFDPINISGRLTSGQAKNLLPKDYYPDLYENNWNEPSIDLAGLNINNTIFDNTLEFNYIG